MYTNRFGPKKIGFSFWPWHFFWGWLTLRDFAINFQADANHVSISKSFSETELPEDREIGDVPGWLYHCNHLLGINLGYWMAFFEDSESPYKFCDPRAIAGITNDQLGKYANMTVFTLWVSNGKVWCASSQPMEKGPRFFSIVQSASQVHFDPQCLALAVKKHR